MNDTPLLRVRSLTVTYGGRPVVDDASFDLAPQSCLGVIGESGAGKTQVFMALMGLLPPQAQVSGDAQLRGAPLLASAQRVRGRDVAMIFQDPMTSLTPHLRVGDQIAEPLVAHRGMSWQSARARAAQLLEQVRMSDVPQRLRQYPHELSGGMRQRAMIAMALACDPQLLIADEPTTALDVSVQAQLLKLLRDLIRERGMALALVTHDMGVIAALADHVLVMRNGKVLEHAPAQALLTTPSHEYTRALLAATPRLEQRGPVPRAAADAAPAPLSARNVSVWHPVRGGWPGRARRFAAVDGVSFDVRDGEALGVVGESGCGKSTLMRALLRLGPAAGGEIVWLGRPVQDLGGAELRRLRKDVQVVFQDPFASLDPRMRIVDIVAEPLRALRPGLDAGERSRRALEALDSVGLGAEYAGRRGRELSGGQCQRVAIARAMILEPKLLVCDEAVSALDVSIQAQIIELLAAFKRRHGTSIVFVSHNLAVVRQLCERVLVMYLGRIVEAGPTQAVFEAPRHPYTRMLLAAVPQLDPVLERARLDALDVRGETPAALDRPSGCQFRNRCPAELPACAGTSPDTEDTGNSHQVACLRWRDLPN